METTKPWYSFLWRIWPISVVRKFILKKQAKSNLSMIDEIIEKRTFAYRQAHPRMSIRMARRKAQHDVHKTLARIIKNKTEAA